MTSLTRLGSIVVASVMLAGCGSGSASTSQAKAAGGGQSSDLSAYPGWVAGCQTAAAAKIQAQADSYGVKVDMASLRVTGFSSNVLAGYVWWAVDVTDVNGRTDVFPEGQPAVLQKLTQKPLFGQCF